MKVAMAITEENLQAKVNPTFGRTPYFLVFNTETKEATYRVNPAMNASGGAGIQAAQAIVDTGCDAVIAYRFGENAAKVINGAQIKSYKAIDASAEENINKLTAGELSPLSDIHPGYHHAN